MDSRGHLLPVLAQLADLIHHRTLLDLVHRDGGCTELWAPPRTAVRVQHTLRETAALSSGGEGVCSHC